MVTKKPTKGPLLRAVALGVGILVVPAMIIFELLVHNHPVYKAGVALIQASPTAQSLLGEPIESARWVYGRSVRGTASFEFDVNGPRGEAEATIEAVHEDARWKIRYILIKLHGQRGQSLPEAKGYAVN